MQASRLLRLGLSEESRPVDDLVDRLAAVDGLRWFQSALATDPFSEAENAEELLFPGGLTLERVVSIKDASKRLLAEADGEEARLRALAGYFSAIAAALAHFGEVICSRPRTELDPVLEDLAAVLPPRWARLMAAAAAQPQPGQA